MTARAVAVCIVVISLSLTACASPDRSVDRRGAQLLDAEVSAARQALAHGDATRAATLLRSVEDTVSGLRASRRISDGRAAEILAAVGDAQDALRAWMRSTAHPDD